MSHERVRVIVEIGLTIALAAVLNIYKITLPWNFAGGSISLAMLPLFVLANRRGVVVGVTAGLLFGLVDYIAEPYFVHPVQVALDYFVGFSACGLAGLFRKMGGGAMGVAPKGLSALVGAVVGGAGRFAASFISGVVFFGANAPKGQPVWLYSVLYNGSYLLPSVIACALLAMLLVPALDRAVPIAPRAGA